MLSVESNRMDLLSKAHKNQINKTSRWGTRIKTKTRLEVALDRRTTDPPEFIQKIKTTAH